MVLHITANSRLSLYLKQEFLLASKKKVVRTPQIMTWQQFWQQWQNQALLSGKLDLASQPTRVLSSFEAIKFWQNWLAEQPDISGLLNLKTTAKRLYQAWCLWFEYQQPVWEHGSQEWQVFERAKQAYQAWLQQHNYQDEVTNMAWKLAEFAKAPTSLPAEIHWHGFDEFPPFIQQFQQLATDLNCQQIIVQQAAKASENAKKYFYPAKDLTDELQQIAAFCVYKLQTYLAAGKNLAEIKIGVVGVDVQQIKPELSFLLDDLLYQNFAQYPLLAEHSTDRLYNFSLGEPLIETALIKNLLQTLNWVFNDKSISYKEFASWLNSRFTPGKQADRFRIDKNLRTRNWSKVSWPGLVERTSENLKWPGDLADYLQNLAGLQQKFSQQKSDLSGFVAQVGEILQLFQQAKTVSLSSDEYQQFQRFEAALEDFAKLQSLNTSQNNQAWLRLFVEFASQITHQAESKFFQPIQIMGALEASGQYFDALWLQGLDDQAWPRPPQPNPFLPLQLQRESKMPRADAKRELEYAEHLTQKFMRSADGLVFSFASMQGDAQMMPSPLIARLQLPIYQPTEFVDLIANSAQPGLVSWHLDAQAPAVADDSLVRGGTRILDLHLKCPLMGFIDLRLGANYGLRAVSESLESADQGSLVHRVLEEFWKANKSLDNLKNMSDQELENQLTSLLDQAFADFNSGFSPAYLASEKARMLQLLTDWLELEKQRKLPFTVRYTEQEHEIKFANFKLKFKLDRLDETSLGSVIVDYKTGVAKIADLYKKTGDEVRLVAPQLAAYLFAVEGEIGALGYGLLNKDGAKFSFAAASDELIFDKKDLDWQKPYEDAEWQDFLADLRRQLNEIAEQISRGDAQMQFANPMAMQYAAGKLALRIPEALMQISQQDEEDLA